MIKDIEGLINIISQKLTHYDNYNLHNQKYNAINNLFYTTVLGFSFHTFSYNAIKFIVTKFIRLFYCYISTLSE